MTPVFPARRRAEEFHDWLEGTSAAEPRAAAGLAATVSALREAGAEAPQARPEFVADLRAQLMEAAQTLLRPDTAAEVAARQAPPRRTKRERRLAAAVGGFAVLSASTSMAVAAQSALPGDTLYPLKRAIESVQTQVHRDDEGRGTVLLDHATDRLAEVDELARSGRDEQQISDTLDDFASQAQEASALLLDDYRENGRASSITELRSFTVESLAALQALSPALPDSVVGTLDAAAAVLHDIDAAALQACPTCTDLDLSAGRALAAPEAAVTLLDDAVRQVVPVAPPTAPTKPAPPSGSQTPPSAAPAPTAPSTPTPPATTPSDTVPDLGGDDPVSPPRSGNNDLNTTTSDGVGDLLNGAVDGVTEGVGGLTDGVGGLTDGVGGLLGGTK